jgi:hypothetical protein
LFRFVDGALPKVCGVDSSRHGGTGMSVALSARVAQMTPLPPPPDPSIAAGDVGGRLAVTFGPAVGPRVGQALPLHRLGAARVGCRGAWPCAPTSFTPVIDGLGPPEIG